MGTRTRFYIHTSPCLLLNESDRLRHTLTFLHTAIIRPVVIEFDSQSISVHTSILLIEILLVSNILSVLIYFWLLSSFVDINIMLDGVSVVSKTLKY